MSKSISRQQKLEKLTDPYPRDFPGRESIQTVLDIYNNYINIDDYDQGLHLFYKDKKYKIAGRISVRRDHGNNIFFNLMDQTGKIQLLAKKHEDLSSKYPPYPYNEWWDDAKNCDLGDCVGVEGTLTSNPRGEPLLLISNWTLLAKALREPGDKHKGIKDPEVKYRHRELDLLSSADSRAVFKKRAEIVFEIRKWLNERDYIEIETPVLQPIYGGATARPFVTKHNALGQDFFLSISSELYLKRALVGGYDRVYSVSRCFRNEGISPEHNPEFTNVEIFATCETYFTMANLTENLLHYLCKRFDVPIFEIDRMMNLKSSDWPLSRRLSPPFSPDNVHKDYNSYAESWEMFVDGMEIASGASDLNDPREQELRLKESEKNATKTVYSDRDEATYTEQSEYDPYDKNYIEALEQGLLPVAGVGIGVDRLCMLLLNKKNIRDTIMFPLLRAKSAGD